MRSLKVLSVVLLSGLLLLSCEKKLAEEAYFKAANDAYADGKFEQASKNFQKLLEYYPDSTNAAEASFNLALIYDNDLNKAAEADKIFDGYVKKYPDADFQGKLYKAAKDFYANGKFKKALKVFQRLIEYFPQGKNAAEASFMLGFINANDLKNLDEAKKQYQLFIKNYPKSDLVDDARFELQNLGKDINELPIFKNISAEEASKK